MNRPAAFTTVALANAARSLQLTAPATAEAGCSFESPTSWQPVPLVDFLSAFLQFLSPCASGFSSPVTSSHTHAGNSLVLHFAFFSRMRFHHHFC